MPQIKQTKPHITLILIFIFSALMLYPRFYLLSDHTKHFLKQMISDNNWEVMCRWDCPWYLDQSTQYIHERSAFFPLYPILLSGMRTLLKLFSADFTPQFVTLILSNLFVILSSCLAIPLGSRLIEIGEHVQSRFNNASSTRPGVINPGIILAGFLMLFPYSIYGLFGYSEGLFIFLFLAIVFCLSTKASGGGAISPVWFYQVSLL